MILGRRNVICRRDFLAEKPSCMAADLDFCKLFLLDILHCKKKEKERNRSHPVCKNRMGIESFSTIDDGSRVTAENEHVVLLSACTAGNTCFPTAQ